MPALFALPAVRLVAATSLFFAFGAALPLINSTIGAYMMERTPKEYIGRASSVLGVLATCAMPIGSAVSGAVAEFTSIPTILIIMGLLMFVSIVVAAGTKTIREERKRPEPAARTGEAGAGPSNTASTTTSQDALETGAGQLELESGVAAS